MVLSFPTVVLCAVILSAQIYNIRVHAQDLQPLGRLLTPEEGCGISKATNNKIVGGTKAKPGAFPWIALIGETIIVRGYRTYTVNCGGALITSRHVLTAAHCISRLTTFVRLGEHDLTTTSDGEHQDIRVLRAVRHPDFNSVDNTRDIGVITLEQDVKFDDRIRPVCLPLTKQLQSKSFVGSNPFMVGWGRLAENGTKSSVLMQVQLPVIENQQCQELYKKENEVLSRKQFSDLVLCAGNLAGGEDACGGDSGGPLVVPISKKGKFPMYQIGIMSYGLGCARPNAPGVYTRVSQFMDWIEEQIN